MAQETLEQTQRRLGLSTAPVTNARTARQHAPLVVPAAPTLNPKGAARIFAVLAGIVVLCLVGYNVVQSIADSTVADDEWTNYPGTYFADSDDILAGMSLEAMQADADELVVELKDELDGYGFEWSTYTEASSYTSSNGYGGDSMLTSFSSDVAVGAVRIDDEDARADIIAIFERVMSTRPDTTVVFSNDEITDDDAEYFFGSSDRDAQAMWSAWSYGDDSNQLQADLDVFDATVPTGDEFGTNYWVPDETSDTLFVRIMVRGQDLLSEADRDEFTAALEAYEGQDKPPYRG